MEAVDLCRTCTIRICLECSQEVGSATFCADCASDAKGPASRGAIVSLVLSAIGLFVPLVGIGGLILGHKVLNAIRSAVRDGHIRVNQPCSLS